PGYVALDRRAVGWGERLSPEQVVETAMGGVGVAGDIAAVADILAAAGGVAARMLSYVGHADAGGGLIEVALGNVCVVEGGRIVHSELLEFDRDVVLARYDELLVERA